MSNKRVWLLAENEAQEGLVIDYLPLAEEKVAEEKMSEENSKMSEENSKMSR